MTWFTQFDQNVILFSFTLATLLISKKILDYVQAKAKCMIQVISVVAMKCFNKQECGRGTCHVQGDQKIAPQ